jgi:pimeloyl-ACP methyl ester carboxylesterase
MTKTVQLSDASMILEDVGEGPAVLLLHGFPSTRRLWSQVVPLLNGAGFRTLLPDLIGYGDTDAPSSVRVDMASQARWLLGLLDALQVERPIVVAHDVGSAAAQLLLVNHPHRVRGLAILDGVYAGNWAMEAVASIQGWDVNEAHRLLPVLARRLGKSDGLREMLAAYSGTDGGLRLIRAARALDPRQTEHLGEVIQAIQVPALVIWGDQDTIFPIDTVARPLAALLRAALRLVPGGHFSPLDCPNEVAAVLIEFLRSVCTPSEG